MWQTKHYDLQILQTKDKKKKPFLEGAMVTVEGTTASSSLAPQLISARTARQNALYQVK